MTEQRTRDDRRKGARRHDPDARIRAAYPLVIGGLLVVGGMVIMIAAVLSEQLGRTEGIAGLALVLLGCVASMPKTFMPVFATLMKKIPFGKNGAKTLPEIVPDDPPPEDFDGGPDGNR